MSSRRVAAVAAAWTGATFFALQGDGRAGFWTDNPMLGALVSGALLFVLGALVLQRIIDARAASRWSVIATVAYRALGRDTSSLLTTLWGVHSGPDPALSKPGGQWLFVGLTPARELERDLPGKADVPVFSDPQLPREHLDEGGTIPLARVLYLLADERWVDYAGRHVEQARDASRSALREWASLMISAQKPREMLNHFAALSHALTRVHGALQQVNYSSRSGEAGLADDWRIAALARFQLADMKGRLLLNELRRLSHSKYRWSIPLDLEHTSLDDAYRRPASVGRWTPRDPCADREVT